MQHVKIYLPAAVLIGGLLAISASAQEAAIVPTPVPTPTGPDRHRRSTHRPRPELPNMPPRSSANTIAL